MEEGFVNINNLPTKVMTFGRWITKKPDRNEEKIILIIPGNPGPITFYKIFMEILHEKHKCPVWIIAQTGQEKLSSEKVTEAAIQPLGLREQTKQKVSFIEEYVPEDAKLHIIGHSIGSYMALELLKEQTIEARIEQVYLLCPVLEKMSETPYGKFVNSYIEPIAPVILCLAWIISVLPRIVTVNSVKIYRFLKRIPVLDEDAVLNLIHPKVLKRVNFMALQELELMKDRDNDIIKKNLKRICVLYSEIDGWCLPEFYGNLKKDFPEIRVKTSKFSHNFILYENKEVAEIVSRWMVDV